MSQVIFHINNSCAAHVINILDLEQIDLLLLSGLSWKKNHRILVRNTEFQVIDIFSAGLYLKNTIFIHDFKYVKATIRDWSLSFRSGHLMANNIKTPIIWLSKTDSKDILHLPFMYCTSEIKSFIH